MSKKSSVEKTIAWLKKISMKFTLRNDIESLITKNNVVGRNCVKIVPTIGLSRNISTINPLSVSLKCLFVFRQDLTCKTVYMASSEDPD